MYVPLYTYYEFYISVDTSFYINAYALGYWLDIIVCIGTRW